MSSFFFKETRRDRAYHMEYQKSTRKSSPSIWIGIKISINISKFRLPLYKFQATLT